MKNLTIRWQTKSGHETYTITEVESCTIGRDESNKIVLSNAQVSRHHAHIKWSEEEEAFILKNTSSKNPIAIRTDDTISVLHPDDSHTIATDVALVIKPFKLDMSLNEDDTTLKVKVECTNCQRINDARASFCKWCGYSLTGSQTLNLRF